jgi:hypothetical protein
MAIDVGDLVATTLRNVSKDIADNVTNDNALLRYLQKGGRIREQRDGGREIDEAVLYGTNSSVQFYDNYDTFTPPTTGQEVIDLAIYAWKQQGGFVSISGKEKKMNAGEYRRFEFAKVRIQQLKANLSNQFATSSYSLGTGSGGKELGGLQLLVQDLPTAAGTVGGINQVTNPFWQNKFSAAVSTDATTILGRMQNMYLQTKRGMDHVDLILADDDMFGYFWSYLGSIQRITSADRGGSGYEGDELYFKNGIPVVYDDQCPNKHMYFLNTKYLGFKYAPGGWFEQGERRQVTNADYEVIPVFTMGNFTCGNRARQGVIIAS